MALPALENSTIVARHFWCITPSSNSLFNLQYFPLTFHFEVIVTATESMEVAIELVGMDLLLWKTVNLSQTLLVRALIEPNESEYTVLPVQADF